MVSENAPITGSNLVVAVRDIKFPLGNLCITANAESKLTREDVSAAIGSHVSGDWGELDTEDRVENEKALKHGFRLLSAYRAKDGTKFWIITEHDRSVTTVLLPEDY